MMWRGVRLHCPLCNGRHAWFSGWFKQEKACRTCGFKWERGNVGFETGSMTINIIITFGLIAATVLTVTLATVPDIPVTPLMVALAAVGLLVPILIFPITHTIWSACDLTMNRLDPGEYTPLPPA